MTTVPAHVYAQSFLDSKCPRIRETARRIIAEERQRKARLGARLRGEL